MAIERFASRSEGGNGREVLEMLARGDFLELHMDLGCVLFRYA